MEIKTVGVVGAGTMGNGISQVAAQVGGLNVIMIDVKQEFVDRPGVVERFFQEARAVNEIGHPNIVDIVAKGGNFLLNVGPRADGVIPDEPAGLLRGLGRWLAVNGESIYGTQASPLP